MSFSEFDDKLASKVEKIDPWNKAIAMCKATDGYSIPDYREVVKSIPIAPLPEALSWLNSSEAEDNWNSEINDLGLPVEKTKKEVSERELSVEEFRSICKEEINARWEGKEPVLERLGKNPVISDSKATPSSKKRDYTLSIPGTEEEREKKRLWLASQRALTSAREITIDGMTKTAREWDAEDEKEDRRLEEEERAFLKNKEEAIEKIAGSLKEKYKTVHSLMKAGIIPDPTSSPEPIFPWATDKNSSPDMWDSTKGPILVREMSDSHLSNAIAYLEKNRPSSNDLKMLMKEHLRRAQLYARLLRPMTRQDYLSVARVIWEKKKERLDNGIPSKK